MSPDVPAPTKPIKAADHIADGVAKFKAATKTYTLAQKRVQRTQEALGVAQKGFEVARQTLSALVGTGGEG
jgi:hypothetical protein